MQTKAQAEGGDFKHTDYDGSTPPKASSLDTSLADLLLKKINPADYTNLNPDVEGMLEYQRAANYLAAAQIFLRSNTLMQDKLTKDDVKRRLLGHWGTCPGLNFVYAQCNQLIERHQQKILFVTGPGHGAPALLSTLYLEGAISNFYPQYPLTREGLEKFIKAFSFPGGFPSHVNAETPGSVHEGGELGYALAVAFGTVMNLPQAISVVVVGDGESETGPTAAAWHGHKYLDPGVSGAVLPILHVNGFKISERTIPGTMDDTELACLYTGYGYQPVIVEYGPIRETPEEASKADDEVNVKMAYAMEWAFQEIRAIQHDARNGKPRTKPRWPMIIMRTPKGWTGPRVANGVQIMGSWRAHQVPLPAASTDDKQLEQLSDWLQSYDPKTIFSSEGEDATMGGGDYINLPTTVINKKALRIIPKHVDFRMGMNKHSYDSYKPLNLPDWKEFGYKKDEEVSAMKAVGKYLEAAMKENPETFRIFSPDELASNKLDEVFNVTHRCFQPDPETANNGGQVIEMLSEHTLQGFLQGYTLTGRTGLFPSYESFLGIVTTMVEQYAKFVKTGEETNWRKPHASLNYIETSTLWRQEHNGYSHQNPGFIGSLLALPAHQARVYLPADANSFVSCIDHVLKSTNYINLMVGSKNPTPTWLSVEDAEKHCVAGASVWKDYSTDEGVDPDVVIVGCGVEVTFEAIAAANLLRNEGVRVRFVNIMDLMILGEVGTHPHALSDAAFNSLFTSNKPVIVNFHGFPKDFASLLFSRTTHVGRSRFSILGYIEQGTTTTPWSMLRWNKVSRYDVASLALGYVAEQSPKARFTPATHELQSFWAHQLREHEKYVNINGEDPAWTGELPEVKA